MRESSEPVLKPLRCWLGVSECSEVASEPSGPRRLMNAVDWLTGVYSSKTKGIISVQREDRQPIGVITVDGVRYQVSRARRRSWEKTIKKNRIVHNVLYYNNTWAVAVTQLVYTPLSLGTFTMSIVKAGRRRLVSIQMRPADGDSTDRRRPLMKRWFGSATSR